MLTIRKKVLVCSILVLKTTTITLTLPTKEAMATKALINSLITVSTFITVPFSKKSWTSRSVVFIHPFKEDEKLFIPFSVSNWSFFYMKIRSVFCRISNIACSTINKSVRASENDLHYNDLSYNTRSLMSNGGILLLSCHLSQWYRGIKETILL